MNDVLGAALQDYQQGLRKHKLRIHNKYGDKEIMPVSTYFRTIGKMSLLDLFALDGCTGKILDAGAAAGSHALILQQRKLNVTALDISAGAVQVMKQRGVKKAIKADIFNYTKKKFDTMLFLMNGIGVAGTVKGLKQLLISLQNTLQPTGQILFDSSDVKYLFTKNLPQHYYGEIEYEYEYRNKRSGWFKWLYIDKQTMQQISSECGFDFQVLMEDVFDQYLGRLTINNL